MLPAALLGMSTLDYKPGTWACGLSDSKPAQACSLHCKTGFTVAGPWSDSCANSSKLHYTDLLTQLQNASAWTQITARLRLWANLPSRVLGLVLSACWVVSRLVYVWREGVGLSLKTESELELSVQCRHSHGQLQLLAPSGCMEVVLIRVQW